MEIREIAIERLQIAALNVDVVRAAEDERAKAVPLGFEQETGRGGMESTSLASIGSMGGLTTDRS